MTLQTTTCDERDWPDPADVVGEEAVEFVLQFHGTLPASGRSDPRTEDKQHIRRQLHPQLKELWRLDSNLTANFELRGFPRFDFKNGKLVPLDGKAVEFSNHFAARVGQFWFVPLITKSNGLGCHLDIRFLRRGQPGDLVKSSGDIDNRIKTLFDALRMPHSEDECRDAPNVSGDEHFHCLLEDDSLITKVTVDTQRLLTSELGGQSETEVALYVGVSVKRLKVTVGNIGYL